MICLVSGVSPLCLGPVALPLRLMIVALAVTRLTFNLITSKKGSPMMNRLKTVLFPLTSIIETVWDIGTKVAAAN